MADKQALTAWKTTAPTIEAATDDGDVLLPLKNARNKYVAKAAELREKAFGDNRAAILEAADNYTAMAEAVGRLIGVISAAPEESAPVDQTENITSDESTAS